jgi:16S rRNA (uracil1498-N3)-methyltransferase
VVTREWRRLLVAPERLAACDGRLVLLAAESHYLRRVLRLRGGEQLALLDGRGHLWTARLDLAVDGGTAKTKGGPQELVAALEQPLHQPLQVDPAVSPALELAVALPRLDGDGLLRMACELGIDRFTPLQAARSVPLERSRRERQQAIVREAVEQCERLWLPHLAPEQAALDAFSSCLATPPGDATAELRLLATTRHQGLPRIEDLLLPSAESLTLQATQNGLPQWIRLAIGPEGGWTSDEEQQAVAAGWRLVSLGDTILRTSTAAVLAAGWMAASRRWLCRRGEVLRS